MESLIESFFNPEVMKASLPYLVRGLVMTLQLSAIVIPTGVVSGAVLAMLFSSRKRWLRALLIVYVDFFRAFPPLVLVIFVFYGLPHLGIEISNLAAVSLALVLNTSSFYGEIFRAGIESIPTGQWEAARSTGLSSFQTMAYVVLPQATRNVLPDLVSNTLEVVKLTSLASVVALPELLRMARIAQGVTFNPTPLVMAALVYLALLWPLVRLLSTMERRLAAPV
jgi:polar amino acid transport system permease protein